MQLSKSNNRSEFVRCLIFFDILHCYQKYRMWSNQYLKENFYFRDSAERSSIGAECRKKGLKRDAWQKRFRSDNRFYAKYGNVKYEVGNRRRFIRSKKYMEHYKTGEGLMVEHDVQLCRQHYLDGTITIGKHVLLAKHCFIDYSGFVDIGNNVQITDGVHILSHYHKHHSSIGIEADYKDNDVQTFLKICDGAVLGTRSVIMPTCHYIGKNARVGAGAVVTKDVPDYAVAVGVPAKVIKTLEL